MFGSNLLMLENYLNPVDSREKVLYPFTSCYIFVLILFEGLNAVNLGASTYFLRKNRLSRKLIFNE